LYLGRVSARWEEPGVDTCQAPPGPAVSTEEPDSVNKITILAILKQPEL